MSHAFSIFLKCLVFTLIGDMCSDTVEGKTCAVDFLGIGDVMELGWVFWDVSDFHRFVVQIRGLFCDPQIFQRVLICLSCLTIFIFS